MFRFKHTLCFLLLFFVNVSAPSGYTFNSPSVNLKARALQTSFHTWSEPILLFEAEGGGEIHNPFVISDAYGNVHVFWSVSSASKGEISKIYYMRRDTGGWTTPIDIIAETTTSAVNATIGPDDFIYLIWNDGAGISYSHAPIQGAESVRNWSEPVRITDSYVSAGIVTSPSGNIYLAYSNSSGIFERVLEPNQIEWSSPITIASNSLTNTAADYVQIKLSSDGTQHVVWTEFYQPGNWPPRGVFYARSIDGGVSWSIPVLMAGDGYDEIVVAVSGDNNVHVAWNGMVVVGGRYHRWSSDEGQNWSDTIEVVPRGIGGTEGPPQILVDPLGTLHMLTTYDKGCPWYTYFESQRWAAPVCIKPVNSKYIEEPAMALSEGNKLHAIYWDDRKTLWYSTTEIAAPWIEPKKIDNELNQQTPNPIPTDTPVIAPPSSPVNSTAIPFGQQVDTSNRFDFNPGQILLFSLTPVLLLLIVIVLSQLYKRTK